MKYKKCIRPRASDFGKNISVKIGDKYVGKLSKNHDKLPKIV